MTGAGKTYTIEGTENNPGIIWKTMEYIMKVRQNYLSKYKYQFKISLNYMEIYKEIVYDLFIPRYQVLNV